MSQQRNEKDKKKRERRSLPVMPTPTPGFFPYMGGAMGGAMGAMGHPNGPPNAMSQWGPPMWNYYGAMPSGSSSSGGMAMAVAGPAASTSGSSKASGSGFGQGQPAKPALPWESSEDDSDEDDTDEEFKPSKKVKLGSKGAKSASKSASACKPAGEKRGPGRPSKAEAEQRAKVAADKNLVQQMPQSFVKNDTVAILRKDECRECRVYVGKVVLKPCGHGKYCFSCINKLRDIAIRLDRPSKCLSNNCYSLVASWLQLFNVSA